MSQLVGGLDEVGYGALAGPIISVVAVFRDIDMALIPPGVTDSKKMTENQRSGLYLPLCSAAFDVGVGHAWPCEIDSMGVHEALQMSYARALADLNISQPDLLIVDGTNKVKKWKGKQIAEPKADLRYLQVSAASIIAKVFRDNMMETYAKRYPKYDWQNNKGYGTPRHEQAIKDFGLLENLHRKRYCKKFLYEKG